MTKISAQDFFRAEQLPPDAVLTDAELASAFWQLKKMQRESQQQQAFWKSVNDSLSDAYKKLAAFQEEVRTSREQLRQANELLEEKVQERTAELRARLEQIEEQQETIRALFTPIIQVWEQVLVLPIVGALDASRAAEMMEALLQAVVDSQCTFVILDLTGVKTVDADTADHLLRIDRAARLLGTQCLLSGLSPAVAQAMIALDIEMRDIVSFGKLSAALKFALRRMGELSGPAPRAASMKGGKPA